MRRFTFVLLLLLCAGGVFAAPQDVSPGIWRVRCGEPEKVTPIAVRAQPPFSEGLDHMPPAPMPSVLSQITFRLEPRGCVVELPWDGSEQIFGLGLHPVTFNVTGMCQSMVVSD